MGKVARTENIYTKNGLKQVINASGRMTKLGVSVVSKSVGDALSEAARSYVVIDELMEFAGKKIAEWTGAADACVTSSASAGLALTVASLICGSDISKVKRLHEILPRIGKRRVIMLKGHDVDYGAPVSEMIWLGGGVVVETGYANGAQLEDIAGAIDAETLAVLYVVSHHCVQKNMPDAASVINLSAEHGVPCIVDAAAEEDVRLYLRLGADFVCYSGAKAIQGPTSGFVACKSQNCAQNMRLQYGGMGRAMKIGKEGIIGLLTAMEEYISGKEAQSVSLDDLNTFALAINALPGCEAEITGDEAGRAISRCRITFHKNFGMSAAEVTRNLKNGDPAIFTRDYEANIGSISIDPRPLKSREELEAILLRIRSLYQAERGE